MAQTEDPKIVLAGTGEVTGDPDQCLDRYLIDGAHSGGRFALVEHIIAPGALAAPMHMHTKEDEFSYVLSGRFAASLGGSEVEAGPGDLVFKPRGQWHTFWNPGDEDTHVLELISPAGLEDFFRLLGDGSAMADHEKIAAMAAEIAVETNEDMTAAIVTKHGLRFG